MISVAVVGSCPEQRLVIEPTAVASSTYLILLLHLAAIPFTRMRKSKGASLVP